MTTIPERVRAANIAAVVAEGQVLVVIRLTIGPNDTLEVTLAPAAAEQLGKTLRGTAAWAASRAGGAA
jgi:hypothetical protein